MNYTFMEKLFAAIRRPDLALRYLMGKQPGEFDLAEVARYVRTDAPTIVEAGAFDGRDTRAFAERWPKGHVYAFEPHPILAARALDVTRGLANVSIVAAALSDGKAATIAFHSFSEGDEVHGSSSILQPDDHLRLAPHIRFGRTINVPAVTLDNWHASVGAPRINLLWLDLQGAELQALKAGERCLAAVQVCHIEVSRRPLYAGGARFSDVDVFLCARGFRRVAVRIPICSGNAIYTRMAGGPINGVG
jgi:FkbM family methyltransferase